MAKFQIIPDRFFKLASKQKPLFNLTKRVQRRLLRQLPWQQWRRRRLRRRGLAKGRRERERTRAKISLGVLQCPVFCITLYLADAVRFKSMISRGRRRFCLSFGHRSLNPHLTMVLFNRIDKTWKNLTLSPKKGTRSLCRDCSWLKRGGLWRPKSQEGRENREPFVGPTNSWCSHHRRESVRVS